MAAVNSAVAQGHVAIWSYYVDPYNQVVWDADGSPVLDTSVQLTFMFGAGSLTDPAALDQTGSTFTVNPNIPPGGYYDAQILLTPTAGLYTMMIVASGSDGAGNDYSGMSDLFEVTTASTSNPAQTAPISPGLRVVVGIIPEPTTFALAGLGAAALLILRRKS
jgi:hypothetical protein